MRAELTGEELKEALRAATVSPGVESGYERPRRLAFVNRRGEK